MHHRTAFLSIRSLACLSQAVAVAVALAARGAPRAVAVAMALYAAYYQLVCEPVFQASWHMNETVNKNVLPQLVLQSKL